MRRPGSISAARLDPAVAGLRSVRLRAEQGDVRRVALDLAGDFRDVAHERGVVPHEMVRREDGDHGLRIAPGDPVDGKEDAGGGAPVARLYEDLRRVPAGEFAGEKRGVRLRGDDDRPLRRHRERHAVERLAEEGSGTRENGVLLGPSVGMDAFDERGQAPSLPAGEDDRPESRTCFTRTRHRAFPFELLARA